MTDHLTPEKRSWNMSRIRSKDTKPELKVRKSLQNSGIRYRLHACDLPGKPDLSNKKRRFAIFINGCFWHQHKGCKKAAVPKSNQDYWLPKLDKNVSRFVNNTALLKKMDFKVFTVWECETKDIESLDKAIQGIINNI